MPTFGDTTVRTQSDSAGNEVKGRIGTCPSPGKALSISVYIDVDSSVNMRCALYTVAGVLVGVTEEKTPSLASPHWETFNFLTQPILSAQDYVIVAWWSGNGNISHFYDIGGAADMWKRYDKVYDGEFPATLTWTATLAAYDSIYCTYESTNILPIPQLRIEIFREPQFADDTFAAGWSATLGSISTDGDILTLENGGGAWAKAVKQISPIDSDAYPELSIRITEITGYCFIYVSEDGVNFDLLGGSASAGFFKYTLPAGKNYAYVSLWNSGASTHVKFDYIFISLGALVPTTSGDVINQGTVTLPLLESGVGGAEFSINNSTGTYTGVISAFDRVIIYLYRLGDSMKKVFGGVVTEYSYEGHPKDSDYYIHVKCMDLGEQLNNPESLIQTTYSGTNGKTIIQDAIAACSRLTDDFVDVDSDIASLHDVIYDEVLPYSIITEITKKATTVGGVVGFDSYVDPAGNMHIFARGKYNSSVDLTSMIEEYTHPLDAHSIKNSQIIYGDKSLFVPETGDDWTESTDGWTVDPLGTLVLEGTIKKVGNYSLHMHGGTINVSRTFSAISGGKNFRTQFSELVFWLKYSGTLDGIILTLLTDDLDYFQFYLINGLANLDWTQITLELGPDGTQPDYTFGSPSWNNIRGIRIVCSSGGDVYLDGLHFGTRYQRAVETNPVSIGLYGIRCSNPESDDTLNSTDECDLKALSLLEMKKSPIEAFTLTVDGNNGFIPGYMQLVVISNDAVNAYYRILEIVHTLYGVDWMTTLKLSNEPILIDYLTLRNQPFQGLSSASLASFGERIVTQHKVSEPASLGASLRVPIDVSSLRKASEILT